MTGSFHLAPFPELHFGEGCFSKTAQIVAGLGRNVLVVTGKKFLKEAGHLNRLIAAFRELQVRQEILSVGGEPSPELIDQAVEAVRQYGTEVVVAVGGGSVLDAGKAISAMAGRGESVLGYLEGIGSHVHDGRKLPFVAIPTTSGTGSEATKNAVLSRRGLKGFKRSLRHDRLVPDVAIVDPGLTLTLPPEVTAACGMDAFTQLLESYVSDRATPLTDALAFEGLRHVRDSLIPAFQNGRNDIRARSGMSLAAFLSGVTLANAGLGLVHGFASSLGGRFDIPHGVVCGTLMGVTTRMNIEWLAANDPSHPALGKYARVGNLFSGNPEHDIVSSARFLGRIIEEWTFSLGIPRLSRFGIRKEELPQIARETDMKNNPVKPTIEVLCNIMEERL
ncbi:MAG: iron-containing alcohol dehydrogenase [Bacteroidales bacterium]|nr:iron-containing alcohol dehydrogenase [Bacteroidales bacterium]